MKFRVREVGILSLLTHFIYSNTEKVLTLKKSSKRVVALGPKPIKLSLVIEEYLGTLFLPKVHTAVLVHWSSSLIV
ncbi:hypothetical protein [Clostridium magnum]|uniref:hypothetical protein n=1 Tax=Clostridium magnum TaxID=33954 RepID=UPI00082C6FE9|nr:hypothetical protein [Clostridium magnum]